MAINTRQKRSSALAFGAGTLSPLLPHVDGTVDRDDRAFLLGLYAGLAPTVAAYDTDYTARGVPVAWTVPARYDYTAGGLVAWTVPPRYDYTTGPAVEWEPPT